MIWSSQSSSSCCWRSGRSWPWPEALVGRRARPRRGHARTARRRPPTPRPRPAPTWPSSTRRPVSGRPSPARRSSPPARRASSSTSRSTTRSSASAGGSSSTGASSPALGTSAAGFGVAMLGFLWPPAAGGFGAKVDVGISLATPPTPSSKKNPYYSAGAKTYIVAVPGGRPPEGEEGLRPEHIFRGMEQGIVALYQKCVHLGCRVPWCETSQWFECPCHGSKYNRVGEKRAARRPAASTASRSRSRAARSPSTPARRAAARRSAPTPPARGPRDRPACKGAARTSTAVGRRRDDT